MLVILPSPIPKLQHAPLPPLKVLRAREHALTPCSSVVFSLDSHLNALRGLGVRPLMKIYLIMYLKDNQMGHL